MEQETVDQNEANNSNKKRLAEKQMRKEDDEEDDIQEDEGTFTKADETVIAQRKKVKAIRRGTSSTPAMIEPEIPKSTASPSPFLGFNFNLAPKTEEKKEEQNASTSNGTPTAPTTSSPYTFQTAFTFSSSTMPVLPSINSSPVPPGIFGQNIQKPSTEPIGTSTPVEVVSPSKVVLKDEPVASGEEDEKCVYQIKNAKLFILESIDGKNEWKEKGKGNFKVNVAKDNSYSRMIMRVEHSGRLILNVRLFPNLKLDAAGDKGVRFAAPNSEKPSTLSVHLIRITGLAKDMDELKAAIEQNKNIGTGKSTFETKQENKETENKENEGKKEEQKENEEKKE
eukprot:TRINITY_DN2516_c0_g1_i1.p1 TRINITY_DN2516_c0_g1~~TRINITY_DN2516_c0_g1_i1.p1  ORF type:complete len:339 (+),score=113.19 TRINITY_DN2516_c0_g1_i1:136-1152(+)